jgi:hypothetical protein
VEINNVDVNNVEVDIVEVDTVVGSWQCRFCQCGSRHCT